MTWLSPVTTVAPAAEPVALDDVKSFLRIDGDSFDTQLTQFIRSARIEIETMTRSRLITQTVTVQTNSFDDLSRFEVAPIQSIEAIEYRDPSGAMQAIDPSAYFLSGANLDWAVRPTTGARWPALAYDGEVNITAIVGYGDGADAVPADIVVAMLQRVRSIFDDRDFDLSGALWNYRV